VQWLDGFKALKSLTGAAVADNSVLEEPTAWMWSESRLLEKSTYCGFDGSVKNLEKIIDFRQFEVNTSEIQDRRRAI
jgi:hypothetical protein